MNKKSIKMLSLLLILSMMLVPTKGSFAAEYKLNVKKYSQKRSNWCWAACSRMVGKYHGKNYTQAEICQYVKGRTVNETATIGEITKALRYGTGGKTVLQSGVAQFSVLRTNMKNKKPALIRMGWDSVNGHIYVVSGAADASGARLNSLYLIDPIEGHASGYFAYSKLVNGTTLASGTGRYTHTWVTM